MSEEKKKQKRYKRPLIKDCGNPNPPINEAFIANQWKPGQSGNPKGKAKGVKAWKTIVKEIVGLAYKTPNELKEYFHDNNYTIQEISVMAQAVKAMQGNIDAAQFLRDTAGEKPATEITGVGNMNPVTSIIIEGVEPADKPEEKENG